MGALASTKQYAIASLVFFLVSVSVAAFTYIYVNSEGGKLETQMEIVSENQQLQERYNTLQLQVEASQAEFEGLKSYLLTEGNTIDFLSELEALAGKNGLQFTTNALEVTSMPNPRFEAIELQLRAIGQREDLVKFLHILETLPYYSRIEQLSLSAQSTNPNGRWLATFTLLVGLHTYDQ